MALSKTDSFMPLTVANPANENREFRVLVIPQGATKQPFKTLTQMAFLPEKAEPAAEEKKCEPGLSVQRDGDRITGLRIQCSCGQVMDLACVYEEEPPA